MTLPKAIEILNDYKMESAFETTPDFEAALKLGIEALKDLKKFDEIRGRDARLPLPGETKE